MESIRSLEKVAQDTLFKAFQEAFKDYEMQLTRPQLLKMLHRRGFAPQLSFGAFSGEKLVSFTFNGTGSFNNQHTAYDTGTGTIEEFRGKGLASEVFEYSIPHLKSAGISQYLLEVLQHNSGAVSLYQRMGFKVSREFNYFIENRAYLSHSAQSQPPSVSLRPVGLNDRELMHSFWDHTPSWQNSFEAVERAPEDFLILGAYKENELLGYCIFEPRSGDIAQLAIAKSSRRKGIASLLLQTMLQSCESDTIKAINYETDLDCFTELMKSIGITHKGKQYEMIKQL